MVGNEYRTSEKFQMHYERLGNISLYVSIYIYYSNFLKSSSDNVNTTEYVRKYPQSNRILTVQ